MSQSAEKPAGASKPRAKAKVAEPLQAFIVSGEGTDEDIAARCADAIPGWAEMGDKVQRETVRLMRVFWDNKPAPVIAVATNDAGTRCMGPPAGSNVTLNTLRSIEAVGSNSQDYLNERTTDLSRYFSRSNDASASSQMSAAMAFVSGANAEDTVQSSLAVQMAATHDAAMRALGRATNAEYVEHAHTFGNIATKLLNAYARQAEVLAKLQRGGEQVIKHVHIDNRGGQAVVTDHVITGGAHGETGHQPYGPNSTPSVVAALPGANPLGNGVPIPRDQGQEAMPAAWGPVARRATG